MTETEFTVHVSSDSSMHMFPNNTVANFTAHFETAFELDSSYEVGLSGIHYTQSWNNVRQGKNTFDFSYTYRNGRKFAVSHSITPGYYPSVQSLMDAMMSIYTTTHKPNVTVSGLEMTYNPHSKRVRISTRKMVVKIVRQRNPGGTTNSKSEMVLNGDIARILGFKDKALISGEGIEGPYSATPSGGFHQMYLYTNIIQPQRHPDGDVQLLRIIAVEDKPNQINVEKTFHPVYYKSLKKHRFETIQFQIMDDMGKLVGFEYGKVVLVLTFRKGYK